MDDREQLIGVSETLAAASAQRDVAAIRGLLANGVVHRTPGGDAAATDAFLAALAQIPGDILFVTVEPLTADVAGDGAIVTGIQHARVAIDGAVVDDRRAFVDWFIREAGEWRLRVAVDLPADGPSGST